MTISTRSTRRHGERAARPPQTDEVARAPEPPWMFHPPGTIRLITPAEYDNTRPRPTGEVQEG